MPPPDVVARMDESKLNRSPLLLFFTQTLRRGFLHQLRVEDLPQLSHELWSNYSRTTLNRQVTSSQPPRRCSDGAKSWIGGKSVHRKRALSNYIWMHIKTYWKSFVSLGIIKAMSTLSAFLGPLFLSKMVSFIEAPEKQDLSYGLMLVALLSISFVVSSLLNASFNVRANILYVKLVGALSLAVFDRVMVLPLRAWSDLDLTEAQVSNLIQSDVEYAGDVMRNINDLWTLPLQIIVTFYLLYTQVQTAFLAGVLMIIVLIPINSVIAKRIGIATVDLVKSRDRRIQVITEALKNTRAIKMCGLEDAVIQKSAEQRDCELAALARRKYLDALCVLLWAVTPVLVPFATFAVTIARGQELSAASVFTTVALLNMLIFPMNAFPWVVNGMIEAKVSIERIVKVLSSVDGHCLYLGSHESGQQDVLNRNTKVSCRIGGAFTIEIDEEADDDDDDEADMSDDDDRGFSDDFDPHCAAQFLDNSLDLDTKNIATIDVADTSTRADSGWKALNGLGIPAHPGDSGSQDDSGLKERPSLVVNAASWVWAPAKRDVANGAESTTVDGFTCGPISATFPRRHLVVVLGNVAAGKSTLLLGLLGELHPLHGEVIPVQPEATAAAAVAALSTAKSRGDWNGTKAVMSYCAQVPAMLSGRSIRDNITLGSVFDEDRYMQILRGCSLHNDCQLWPGGDSMQVLPGSSNLSGGQRLRIGVARALYSQDAERVLLDDPFSALDHSTAESLLQYLYEEEVLIRGRLVILATHSVHLFERAIMSSLHSDADATAAASTVADLNPPMVVLESQLNSNEASTSSSQAQVPPLMSPLADRTTFLLLHGGALVTGEARREQLVAMTASGPPSPTQAHGSSTPADIANSADDNVTAALKYTPPDINSDAAKGTPLPQQQSDVPQQAPDLGTLEEMRSGHIGLAVFRTYFGAAGWPLCIAVIASTVMMQASANLFSFWLACWANPPSTASMQLPFPSAMQTAGNATHNGANDDNDETTFASFIAFVASLWPSLALPQLFRDISNDRYLRVAAGIAAVNIVCAVLRSFLFARGGLVAAKVLYSKLARAVFHADISFFERISVGKIVNRLGSDMETVDDQLPFMLNIVMAQLFLLTGSFLVIAATDPAVIVVLAVVLVVYYRLQRFYRASSRELRRLGSIHRSPVVSLVADCVANAATIRSLGGARSCKLSARLAELVDTNLRICLSSCVASQWISIRLQLLGALVASTLALSATAASCIRGGMAVISPGLLGLSLSLCLTVVGNLNDLIGSVSETEQEMVSAERVIEFMDIEDECLHDDSVIIDDIIDDDGQMDAKKTTDHTFPISSTIWRKVKSLWPSSKSFKGTANEYRSADRTGLFEPLVDEGDMDDVEAIAAPKTDAFQALRNKSITTSKISPAPVHTRRKTNKQEPGMASSSKSKTQPLSTALQGDIVLQDVYMRYSPTAAPVLRGCCVTIPAGSIVSIVGRTGAGKSSLLRLLLRLNPYSSGSITIGGRELKTMDRRALRRMISVVPQDPFLFSGSIRSNVDPYHMLSDTALSDALDASGFPATLVQQSSNAFNGGENNNGTMSLLDVAVTCSGAELSQGQKQLLCLARAFAQGTGRHILLLDEVAAAVDPVCETAIYQAIRRHARTTGCTVLLVGHQPETVRKDLCTLELRVEDGQMTLLSMVDGD